ncbi:MAG: hypothetical protein ABFD79_09285 [Phycisphaerales bacterium]
MKKELKKITSTFIYLILFLQLCFFSPLNAAEDKNIFSIIGAYIATESLEEKNQIAEKMIDYIEANKNISSELLKKINEPNLPEGKKACYIWAIGFTQDTKVTDKLIETHKSSSSELIKDNALRSLSMINDKKSCEYIFTLEKQSDQANKYNYLNLLAEMQYERALPETYSVLQSSQSWQSFFIFGKMGDVSIPYLIEQINDANTNVRGNAMYMLGIRLLATQAVKPMQKRYWIETDNDIKNLILSSLERITTKLDEMEEFSKLVVEKEKDANLKKFARETIDGMAKNRQSVDEFISKKKYDPNGFDKEYAALYKSCGHEGDIKKLGEYSTINDEDKLKKLKERILQRNSDECFYDYDEVNMIIMMNRLIAENTKK